MGRITVNKGITKAFALVLLSVVITSFLVISFSVKSQGGFIADDFYTNLLENEAGPTWGYAVYEFRNPTVSSITIDSDNFLIRMDEQTGATPTQNIRHYILERVEYSENITDYEYQCNFVSNGTGSMSVCDNVISGWHWFNHTKEEPVELSSYSVGAGETIKIRIEATWPLKTGFNSREWFPQLVYGGYVFEQSKWAWWNSSSFSYRYPIVVNDTSTTMSFSVDDDRGVDGDIIWTRYRDSEFVYSSSYSESGPTGNIAIANETHEQFWEKDSDFSGNSPASVWLDNNNSAVWHLNADGVSIYDSTNSRNASLNGGSEVSGLFGNAIDLDGGTEHIRILGQNLNFTNPDTGAWSLSMWVNPDSAESCGTENAEIQNLVSTNSTAVCAIEYLGCGGGNLDSHHRKLCFLSPDCGTWHCGTTNFTNNLWQHVVMTYDGSGGYITYLNGTVQGTDHGGVKNDGLIGVIGKWRNNLDRNFDGQIDEVKVFDKNLTVDEVLAELNNGVGQFSRLGDREENKTADIELSGSYNYRKNNDTVRITAKLTEKSTGIAVPNALVRITVYDSNENVYAVDEQMTEIGDTGVYAWTNVTPSTSPIGVYTANVRASMGGTSNAINFRVCNYGSGTVDGIINDC